MFLPFVVYRRCGECLPCSMRLPLMTANEALKYAFVAEMIDSKLIFHVASASTAIRSVHEAGTQLQPCVIEWPFLT